MSDAPAVMSTCRVQSPTSVRIRHELGALSLRVGETALWIASAILFAIYAWARIDGELHRRQDLRTWDAASVASTIPAEAPETDLSLWSRNRIQSYQASLSLPIEKPLASLYIADLDLRVPIYSNASALHLNRGAGVIEGTSRPGEGGNLGIAGHRDGYFRALKDLRRGALIDLTTHSMQYTYRVTSIDIVSKENVALLLDTDEPTITLVTCFPFYHLGSAPQRYIVRGALERSVPRR